MRESDGTGDNAYILVRVFDLDDGRSTGVKFFRDPWSLHMEGVLNFRSDEGYKVFCATNLGTQNILFRT
jgi:hypothetical protein